jgi:hypothetical protein
MAKPKKIYLPENARHSGIDITYIKSANSLRIGGWYDGMVTEKDCKQAFSLLNIEEFNKL